MQAADATPAPIPSPFVKLLDSELSPGAPNGLRVASLLCGCGGLDLGFRAAGFEVAFANDHARTVGPTYAANFGVEVTTCDVRELYGKDLGSPDVVTGWFPLVKFSPAGEKMLVENTPAGDLYFEQARIIVEASPRFFVLTTDTDLATISKGASAKCIAAAFIRAGYRTTIEVHDLVGHGVPQAIERCVIVGIRRDAWKGAPLALRPQYRPKGSRKGKVGLLQAFGQEDAIGTLAEPHEVEVHEIEVACRGAGSLSPMIKLRDEGGTAGALLAGWRRMTVRESARMQTFPDSFRFVRDAKTALGQVWAAVPPLFAKRIAESIAEYAVRGGLT